MRGRGENAFWGWGWGGGRKLNDPHRHLKAIQGPKKTSIFGSSPWKAPLILDGTRLQIQLSDGQLVGTTNHAPTRQLRAS